MTPVEYVQLKAFARIDGFMLSILWVSSFACYLIGLADPEWTLVALILTLVSPFFVARRLRSFRDEAREGLISFMRGWVFVILVFFYAGLLFALIQYAYFAYLDQGYFFRTMSSMMSSAEAMQVIHQYGMADMFNESMQQMQQMRPIDMALNVLTTNILIGMMVGVPIAAVLKSDVKHTKQ